MAQKGKFSMLVIGLFAVLFVSVVLSSSTPTIIYILLASIVQKKLNIMTGKEDTKEDLPRVYASKSIEELATMHQEKLNLMKEYTEQVDKRLDDVYDRINKL